MEDELRWEDCDVYGATRDLVDLLPIFEQFAQNEKPDSELYLPAELVGAVSALRREPSVKNAKALVAIAPSFRQVFQKRTVLGMARHKGSILAQVLVEDTQRTSADYYMRFDKQLMRSPAEFLSDELLIFAYLVPHLIAHKDEQTRSALLVGFDLQMGESMFERGLLFGDSTTFMQVYTMIVADFRKNLNRETGSFSENSLDRIVVGISRGNAELLRSYPLRLNALGDYAMNCIHEVLNQEDHQ